MMKPLTTRSSALSTRHSSPTQSSVLSPHHSSLTQSSVLSTQHSSAGSDALLLDLCTDLLARGHDVRFRAPGRSMYPAIREGEAITVRPVSPSAVKKGDIILYRWEKGVIAHRVVGIDKAVGAIHFMMRGDASGAQDERVAPEQILGKVVVVERGRRRIDPYSLLSKVRRILQPFASHFKQWALQKKVRRP